MFWKLFVLFAVAGLGGLLCAVRAMYDLFTRAGSIEEDEVPRIFLMFFIPGLVFSLSAFSLLVLLALKAMGMV